MKRLIVNADDFGLTAGVNRGVEQCCLAGGATSVTLMTAGPAWMDAVRIAHSTLRQTASPISIGCHVVLMDGTPLLSPAMIPSLIDTVGGRSFRPSFSSFTRGAMTYRFDPQQLFIEIVAQVQRLQQSGIAVSHADTHKHAHLFPAIMETFIMALKSRGIRALRNPFYPFRMPSLREVRERPRLLRRFAQVPLLRSFASRFRELVEREGLVTTDGCIGVYAPAFGSVAELDQTLRDLPNGTWEIVCHPGYVTPELDAVHTRLRASRELELQILCSEDFRLMLDGYGFELCSFHDLTSSAPHLRRTRMPS